MNHRAQVHVPIWHHIGASEVTAAFELDPHLGLSAAQVVAHRAAAGENRLPLAAHKPAWLRFAMQFHNPLIYVLLVAGLITLALANYVDAGVIFGVVLINALIGHIQEGKAQRALDAVRNMLAARCTVWRDGQRQLIDAVELVPGDVVLLDPGDKIAADVRWIQAKNLRVMEAALTGESTPVAKVVEPVPQAAALADRRSMGYAGTLVVNGQGRGVVVATGTQSEIGRIGTLVGEVQTLATPLTRRLDQFARQITVFILAVATATLLYGHFVARLPMLEVFLAVVGLAVAAIPEGLPAVVTVVLAVGTRAMARNRAIVRRLPAVETLGSVTVICSDKTGTLTKNEMTAVHLVLGSGREVSVSGAGYTPEGGFQVQGQRIDPDTDPAVHALARCAVLCNDAQMRCDATGRWCWVGDPLEAALLVLGHKAGLPVADMEQRYPRLDAIPFESERRFMATLHHDHAGHNFVLLKGAPERVLALCTSAAQRAIEPEAWLTRIEQAAGAGERVLALAQCPFPAECTRLDLQDITARFELLGLVGLIDPPREEAIAAVAQCREAGIRVKMITGDHVRTALAIAHQLGLSESGQAARALTGEVIETLDETALRQQALLTDVFARASPEHKLRLIAALQAQGHLVAMTGDGVNDAPALKAADIGVAMGQKGTDAAREASDLVLTDDNFATIAQAVRQGRVVYDNIKKSLLHMLPTNGGEASVIVLAIFAGVPLPVTAGQILWVNTVTSVTLALSLAFESAEPSVMAHAPRPKDQPIITRALALRILFVVALMAAATFGVFNWELARSGSLETARTAAVNTIVVCELFYLFNVRRYTEHALRWETLTGNRMALMVGLILVVLQLLFTYAPPMQQLFQSSALDLTAWAAILGSGLTLFLAVECEKVLLRRCRVHRL